MSITNIKTFGDLKASGYRPKGIKDELRENLIQKIKKNENAFPGVYGYEDTVIPELERAILSRHNINLLGLRGQAKTRMARQMVNLLDEYIPVVDGSEINDDPYSPISRFAKELMEEMGDGTPIRWMHRSERFSEKLATPDTTVADLIGDVDPIKAANLKLSYADDRVLHYGMIPRANRCIFVINELPDLQAKIQVSLFNILQEGDVQIRGFKLRMPLDIQFVFTANPEDYTNRGSIVTPLKDRIGSQILTHYPADLETAKKITAQEAKFEPELSEKITVPELAKDVLEQISFEARNNEYIDEKSGVSARMSITAYQNLMSTAERRLLKSNENQTTIRLSDFLGVVPAITGKVELVYEGELEGAASVAENLIENAVKTLFDERFPKIEKLQKKTSTTPYDPLIAWFADGNELELSNELTDDQYRQELDRAKPLWKLISDYQPGLPAEERYFLAEMILWALGSYQKISRNKMERSISFSDEMTNFLRNL
ncbi:magnesium chelatase subunit I [Cruoricaptor ignavus]|uniref:Magnesium chelatase subunit I n=1 Tax=Cruoricaptor ignavus TaxID=1118202 RepID=A0A1M6C035_9FLAO|nr:AAA family ATPase [Cruoricaptor ignavus]SHI54386.1 magnesium chelatase subunit I [Cruoricaptor ignavus]